MSFHFGSDTYAFSLPSSEGSYSRSFLAAAPALANAQAELIASRAKRRSASASSGVRATLSPMIRGGNIVSYAHDLRRLRDQNKLVVFNGQCASACTMYLSARCQSHLHRARCVLRVPSRLRGQCGHERVGERIS